MFRRLGLHSEGINTVFVVPARIATGVVLRLSTLPELQLIQTKATKEAIWLKHFRK